MLNHFSFYYYILFNIKSKSNSSNDELGFLQLRLNDQEKEAYIKLFNENSITLLATRERPEKRIVLRKDFPKLLGMIGTDIAQEFAHSIYDACTDKDNYMSIKEYLKYMDIYHHGDQNERCLITFKLMDKEKNGNVKYSDFKNYLHLILSAIEKVQPSQEPLLSESDIQELFNKIANKKTYFSYDDFKQTFFNKPELLSWIDYFKNNDEDIVEFLNLNIKELLVMFFKFFYNFNYLIKQKQTSSPFEKSPEENSQDIISNLINEILRFNKKLNKKMKSFTTSNHFSNIRSVFDNLMNKKATSNYQKFDLFTNIANDMQEIKEELTELRQASVDNKNTTTANLKISNFRSSIRKTVKNDNQANNGIIFGRIRNNTALGTNIEPRSNAKSATVSPNINNKQEIIKIKNLNEQDIESDKRDLQNLQPTQVNSENIKESNAELNLMKNKVFALKMKERFDGLKKTLKGFDIPIQKVKTFNSKTSKSGRIDFSSDEEAINDEEIKMYLKSKAEQYTDQNSQDIDIKNDIIIEVEDENEPTYKINQFIDVNDDSEYKTKEVAIKPSGFTLNVNLASNNYLDQVSGNDSQTEMENKNYLKPYQKVTKFNSKTFNNLKEKSNKPTIINTLIDKLEELSYSIICSVKWIDLSYHWIEQRYSIPNGEKDEKEIIKKDTKPKNIHNKGITSKIKPVQIKNSLKTTDENFKLLIKAIMGIQLSVVIKYLYVNLPSIILISL